LQEIERCFLVALNLDQEHLEDLAIVAKTIKDIKILYMYKEALNNSVYRKKWQEAINKELQTLIKNGT
jgi:hypothetical protein